jgi:hypothetical protein
MQQLIQLPLIVVMIIAAVCLFGFKIHQDTVVNEGHVIKQEGIIEVGQPWPWLTWRTGGPSTGLWLHWSSVAIGMALAALVAGSISNRLRATPAGTDPGANRQSRIVWRVIAAIVLIAYFVMLGLYAASMRQGSG